MQHVSWRPNVTQGYRLERAASSAESPDCEWVPSAALTVVQDRWTRTRHFPACEGSTPQDCKAIADESLSSLNDRARRNPAMNPAVANVLKIRPQIKILFHFVRSEIAAFRAFLSGPLCHIGGHAPLFATDDTCPQDPPPAPKWRSN
jgi:hypothetical protein